MINLDNEAAVKKMDSLGMLDLTMGYPQQFSEGLRLAQEQFSAAPKAFDHVIILGTGGGSAASGNLLRSYLFDRLPVPLVINQGYRVPRWVDGGTLALVVTHSGNTEEVLSATEQAMAQGAQVVAITAGGKLMEMAKEKSLPTIVVPGGLMPRVALGYIFVPILHILEEYGLVEGCIAELEETIALFAELGKKWGPQSPMEENLAKQIAGQIFRRVPVVYGSLPFTDSVAWRWKNQFGENSKMPAFWNAIPALHHDEIVGWDAEAAITGQFACVFLKDQEDGEKITKRIQITNQILSERTSSTIEVETVGKSRLARLFSLVYLGDFVTCYLPILGGIDPTPVAIIDLFKQKMGQ
jgi:glucose/mannose-6-phosphate isomerase